MELEMTLTVSDYMGSVFNTQPHPQTLFLTWIVIENNFQTIYSHHDFLSSNNYHIFPFSQLIQLHIFSVSFLHLYLSLPVFIKQTVKEKVQETHLYTDT